MRTLPAVDERLPPLTEDSTGTCEDFTGKANLKFSY